MIVNASPDEWNLYTHSDLDPDELDRAAAALNDAINEVIRRARICGSDSATVGTIARQVLVPVMRQYARLGAADSEPEMFAAMMLSDELHEEYDRFEIL